jgi:hypothetical protein
MRVTALSAVFLLAVTTAFAQGVLELQLIRWSPGLDATIRSVTLAHQVDPDLAIIDLKHDLGMSDERHDDYRLIAWTGPRSRVRFGYMKMDYSGDTSVERTIDFNGETYTVGTRVVSDLSLKYGRLGWVWEPIGTTAAGFGFILEAKRVDLDAGLLAPDLVPQVSERHSLSATFPSVGLALDLHPSRRFGLYAEVSGISAGSKGHLVDGEAGVRIAVLPFLTVLGGYRTFDLRVEDQPDFGKFKNSGGFVGLALGL